MILFEVDTLLHDIINHGELYHPGITFRIELELASKTTRQISADNDMEDRNLCTARTSPMHCRSIATPSTF